MSQKAKLVVLVFLVIAIAAFWAYHVKQEKQLDEEGVTIGGENTGKTYSKIISLAPSTTEMLFSLGLGDKVIGVSEFCNYPEEAKVKPKMGGLMNPNYEAIVAAKPDVVIVFNEMLQPTNKFKSLKIETLTLEHSTVQHIFQSIQDIGRCCGASEQAKKIVKELTSKMSAIQNKYASEPHSKVLIIVGHDISQDITKPPVNIKAAGDEFYNQMISYAGGKNAYSGTVSFPTVNNESIISMNPEVIIDLVPADKKPIDANVIIKQWKNISQIDAVKKNRIYVFTEDYMTIPGPRVAMALEKLAVAIKPELTADANGPKGN
jgi:iron complex transport system substrate-binding protein